MTRVLAVAFWLAFACVFLSTPFTGPTLERFLVTWALFGAAVIFTAMEPRARPNARVHPRRHGDIRRQEQS